MSEPDLIEAAVEPDLRGEFPELRLVYVMVSARSGRSPETVRERLKEMSNRFTGPRAVQLRQEPIPWAYRVFFRQVGIDPDDRRTPVEQFALDRMRTGGFRSRNLLDDAIAIATVETGVPVIAFDADRVEGALELRLSRKGELLGPAGRPLSASQIVIADAERALAVLFADLDPERGVTPKTERMLLSSVQVAGVPDIAVEEALWMAAEIVTGAG
ncbi:MAG: phenylalanine--tRNA ligase beta subunit-related protein [Thermoleophilaceae bacterium]